MDHTSIAGIFEFYGELNDYKDVAIKPTHLHKTFNELRARAKDISVKTEHLFVQTINKMLPLKIPEVVQSWSKILFGLRICVNSFADQYDNTNVILKDKFNGFLKTLQPKTELIDLDEWPEIIPYGFYSGVGELIPIGTEGRQILVNSKDDHTPIPAPAPPQFRHSAKEFARRFNSGNHYLLVTTDPLANPSDSLKDTDFKATAFKNRGAAILFRTMEKAAKSELNVGWVLNPNQLNRFGRKYMSNDQYLKIMFPYPSDQVLNLMLNIHENFNDSVNYVLIDGTMFADKQHIIDHPDFAKVSALAIKAKKPILILQKNEEGLLQVTPHDTIKSKSLNNGLNYIELLQ